MNDIACPTWASFLACLSFCHFSPIRLIFCLYSNVFALLWKKNPSLIHWLFCSTLSTGPWKILLYQVHFSSIAEILIGFFFSLIQYKKLIICSANKKHSMFTPLAPQHICYVAATHLSVLLCSFRATPHWPHIFIYWRILSFARNSDENNVLM